MKRIILIIVFSIVFLCPGLSLASHNRDRVLLLASYHPDYASFYPQVEGVVAGLVEAGIARKQFILDVEFMDTKRFPPREMVPRFKIMLEHKLSVLPPYDIVITADDNATRFAIENQRALFKNRPIVFLGVNNVDFALAQNANPLVTGVIEAVSIDETLDLITRIRPKTDKPPVIIADVTPSARGTLRSILDLHPDYSKHVLNLETLTHQQLFATLEKLPPSDNVILLSAHRDYKGSTMSYKEHISKMREVLKVPIFHLWRHNVDDGLLGGVVVSHFEQGRKAANMAGAILNGSNITEIPVIEESPNITLINYDVMQEFGVDPSLLPPNTTMINEPTSIYQQYKMEINIAAASFFLILSILTVFLSERSD